MLNFLIFIIVLCLYERISLSLGNVHLNTSGLKKEQSQVCKWLSSGSGNKFKKYMHALEGWEGEWSHKL